MEVGWVFLPNGQRETCEVNRPTVDTVESENRVVFLVVDDDEQSFVLTDLDGEVLRLTGSERVRAVATRCIGQVNRCNGIAPRRPGTESRCRPELERVRITTPSMHRYVWADYGLEYLESVRIVRRVLELNRGFLIERYIDRRRRTACKAYQKDEAE